jgi:hypothetical protein
MAMPSIPTKAELHAMLAEAVRNTQPQSVDTQVEPARDVQPDFKPKRRLRKTGAAPKRTAKIKSVRASAGRKGRTR